MRTCDIDTTWVDCLRSSYAGLAPKYDRESTSMRRHDDRAPALMPLSVPSAFEDLIIGFAPSSRNCSHPLRVRLRQGPPSGPLGLPEFVELNLSQRPAAFASTQ